VIAALNSLSIIFKFKAMNTKRNLTALFLMLVLFAGATAHAQTAPKKTTAPKTTTKKPVVKKKPVKAGKVFICDGSGGYHFHSRKTCAVLAKCKGRVLDMTKQEAINNWSRKQCKSCY